MGSYSSFWKGSAIVVRCPVLAVPDSFPPQVGGNKKERCSTPKRETDISQLVVKSCFIRPNAGQLQTTHSSDLKANSQEENQHIFAGGNEKKGAVIPRERLSEVFGKEGGETDGMAGTIGKNGTMEAIKRMIIMTGKISTCRNFSVKQ